jgi:arylsulfatase A-like enzyme
MRILYIDIDSQRPDHLGCYGYHRATSPAIDAVAKEGIVFERVYTPDAPCLPSRTAFYSGRFGIQTGVVGHGGTASQPKTQGPRWRGFRDAFSNHGLAHQLQRLGFHTAMISPFGARHSAHWFYAGFNEIHDTNKYGMESAEEIMPTVERWLSARVQDDHWYLHINFWDPHTPYRAPLSYGEPFAKEPLPKWLDDAELIRRHNKMTGPHTSLDVMMYDDVEQSYYPRHPGKVTDLASMRRMIDGYDTGVRYMDDHVGRIVAALKSAGVYDDTAIIISGDHGENLGELGIYAEHGTADEYTCHIPLIIKFPGGAQGKRDPAFHYNLDLAPTLMELLGCKPEAIWDGKSYATTIRTGEPAGRDEVILSQGCHVCQRSVRWDKWLYLRTWHDGFHLFPSEMLFDLEADPHEQDDVTAKFPEICREGAWRLSRWHDAQMEKMATTVGDCVDPLWTVIREGGPAHANPYEGSDRSSGKFAQFFLKYLKRLEATGRKDGAAILRERYGVPADAA